MMKDMSPEPDLRLPLLLSQLEIPWALFEYHAASLGEEDLFWAPSSHQWTMHRTDSGWVPDLAEEEPDPVPVTTPAWITWHIGWWMQAATAQVTGELAPGPEDTGWPGETAAIVQWLRNLYGQWREALAEVEDLDRVIGFPWPEDAGKTIADLAGWVAVELTKNVSELGQILIIRRAGQ